ncbi:MAG: leucine-rich repeat protein [Porcipelethomonas sp.]
MKCKKIMAALISSMMIFAPASVSAESPVGDYTYKYFTYNINSDETITIISCDSSVTAVEIPETINGKPVCAINSSTFTGCDMLSSITVSEGNEYFSTDDNGILMNKNQTRVIKCPAASGIVSCYLAPTVTSIAPHAFENCSHIELIGLPEGTQSVGTGAFSGTSFTSITVPAAASVGSGGLGYNGNEKISGFTIYGFYGSPAESYAAENGFTFISTDNNSFNVYINGNLYFYNDDTSFKNTGIVVTDKSGEPASYAFSDTPAEIFEKSGYSTGSVSILSTSGSIIAAFNVRTAIAGDANTDGVLNVRDAAFIAARLARGENFTGFEKFCADKNKDGKADIRDAAAAARELAAGKK